VTDEDTQIPFRNQIINESQMLVLENNNGDIGDVKIDCDAYSLLVSVKGVSSNVLSSVEKNAIREFLMGFGSETSKVHTPPFAMGAGGIFGCSEKKSKHLKPDYEDSEVIVSESPVKIAIHKSCKDKLIASLKRKQFPTIASNNPHICFEQKGAKPTYGVLIDAIIESCYVDTTKEFFIHIADFGMRIPIVAHVQNEYECPVGLLFKSISELRGSNVNVEIAQLDIAFTRIHNKNQYIQISGERRDAYSNAEGIKSFLYKTKHEIFPLHTVNFNDDQSYTLDDVKGTVRITNRSPWPSPPAIYILSDDENEDFQFITNHYATNDTSNTSPSMKMNTNTVFNLKLYSAIFHALSPDKSKIPTHHTTMNTLDDRTFSQLKQMLLSIWKSSENASSYASEYGIGWRTEISIRPTLHGDDNSLRCHGNLNDFLVHVHLSLHDCLKGTYRMMSKEIAVTSVQSKLKSLINQLSQYLKFRGSNSFYHHYKSSKMSMWLKAQMSLVLMTAGFAPSFKMDHVKRWLKGLNRFDPFLQKDQLMHHNYLHSKIKHIIAASIHQKEQEATLSNLKTIFKQFFQGRTTKQLLSYVKSGNNDSSSLECYKKLSLIDKLSFASNVELIIPQITKSNDHEEVNEPRLDEHETYNDKNIEDDPWVYTPSPLNAPELENVLLQSHINDYTVNPTDPISSAIQSLSSLSIFSDITSPVFVTYLAAFILKCHECSIVLPGQSSPLMNHDTQTNDNSNLSLAFRMLDKKDLSLTNKNLRDLCSFLDVKVIGSSRKNDTFLQALCLHYHFPCLGVIYDFDQMKKTIPTYDNESILNSFYNELLSKDVVLAVNSVSHANHQDFYRNFEKKRISIMLSQMIVWNSNEEISFIPRTKDHSIIDCYIIICYIVNIPVEDGHDLRNIIIQFLKGTHNFSHHFLLDDGMTNPAFVGINTIDELQHKHSFQLNLPNHDMRSSDIEKYFKFIPDIIFPIISVIYCLDITFYDYHDMKMCIYAYHLEAKKSITYQFNCTTLIPRHKSIIIRKNEDKTYVYGSMETKDYINYTPFQSYASHSLCLGTPTTCETKICKSLNNHPWGNVRGGRNSTVMDSLANVLTDISHNSSKIISPDEIIDKLQFVQYIHDLQSSTTIDWTDLTNLIFDKTIMINSSILHESKQKSIDHLTSDDVLNDYQFLCPLFCVKFKINVAIWVLSERKKSTHIYSFNKWEKKVKYQTLEGYHEVGNDEDKQCIVYLQSSGRKGFFKPPAGHWIRKCDHHEMLIHNFSYPDASLYEMIISKLEELPQMSILTDTEYSLGNLVDDHTHLLPFQVTDLNGTHVALLVIFPVITSTGVRDVCFICDIDSHSIFTNMINTILSTLFGQNHHQFLLHSLSESEMTNTTSELRIGRFKIPLHMYIAYRTNNVGEFKSRCERLNTERDLLRKTKKWIIDLISNKQSKFRWIEQLMEGICIDLDGNITTCV